MRQAIEINFPRDGVSLVRDGCRMTAGFKINRIQLISLIEKNHRPLKVIGSLIVFRKRYIAAKR